ncbi:unnamed protein product [Linum trigynum]|uniref:Uncharacterized protein n=1 Tax=Linum trigynum TaxID=586398 RepID=A0AAV2EGF0_9ROSI
MDEISFFCRKTKRTLLINFVAQKDLSQLFRPIKKLCKVQKSQSIPTSTTEKALKLLESVSLCLEGITDMFKDSTYMEAVVRKAMVVRNGWQTCSYFFRSHILYFIPLLPPNPFFAEIW